DVAGQLARISDACAALAAAAIRVSLFIDPDQAQLDASAAAGAAVVELHTGCYADATTDAERETELARVVDAARYGAGLGLTVHAGHGLHYQNVVPIAAIEEIVELNIGHSIIARSVFDGLPRAVEDMKYLILGARRS
ncbi:MAG: pyridoxine 5'-phosphate synthase, partial [Gammaproteobacteria bacterium]|nr:pyridoxine 5'-phosphate synthase [Gammaproteobacteria bacterium]